MLSKGEDVEAYALKERGWSVLAIARHLGRDPKTIRAYLSGELPVILSTCTRAVEDAGSFEWRAQQI